ALTEPRFAGAVNGRFEVDGAQRGRAGLLVHATGTVTETDVLGGRLPELAFDATVDDQRLDLTARGQIAGYDLATLSGVPGLTGVLTGTVDTRVAVPNLQQVSIDTLDVDGTFTLEQPTLMKVPFETVKAQLAMADGVADIRQLEARGDGFVLTGQGRFGLGPGDESDFGYRLQAESLLQPAKAADLPITGAATTEGRVTGARAAFTVTGALAGDQLAYGDTASVGTVNAQYTVRLPDFDPARLDVETTIEGQTVHVAGQTLTAVSGTVGYMPQLLRFDVTGDDALRTLAARGTLALQDRGQQLTLDRLAVQREGVTWALAPDTTARVDITPEQATIAQLRLANGAQQLDVEGTVGILADAQSSLRVQATGVRVRDVLVLAAQEFDGDGTLDLSATIGGTRERPVADAQLELTEARVRNIDVERVGGRVTFDGTLGTVNLRLQKDANSVLTANGIVPRTLFAAKPEGGSDEHIAPTPNDRLDVAITSTPIDLALAEGLTPYVQKLGGQAQIDVRLTNSGRDPHVAGAVFLTNGTLFVPATGVSYEKLAAILTFDEERVVISEMGVQTTDGDLLTVEGELGLRRQQARTVSLRMKGEDFRILDNEYGRLALDTDLTISGTLVAPAVEGTLQVSDGRLELDEILPRVSSNTYATQAEYQGIPTDALSGPVVPNIMGDEFDTAKSPVSGATTPRGQVAPQGNQQGPAAVPAPDPPTSVTPAAAPADAPATGQPGA
ncbi:MAG: translocation/assembly module TamB domain-containing protein, partial [Acidobacteria bacterium]|nr:translocation/assembly module TamB domain-containing protein [Acidobacteriota bacterium]